MGTVKTPGCAPGSSAVSAHLSFEPADQQFPSRFDHKRGLRTLAQVASVVSALPAESVEIPKLNLEICRSPESIVEARLDCPSSSAFCIVSVPSVALANRPLEIGIAAIDQPLSAVASFTQCITCHAMLSIVVQVDGQSLAPHSVPVIVRSCGDAWIVRALINPTSWATAACVTVVSLSLAGRPLPCDCLPATLRVGYNHAPAPAGAVLASARAGDVAALQAALEAGGSTEEAPQVRGGTGGSESVLC